MKPTGYKKNPAYYADPASAYRNIDVQSVSVPVYQPKVYKTTGYNPENAQQPEYPIDYSSFKRTFRYWLFKTARCCWNIITCILLVSFPVHSFSLSKVIKKFSGMS